MSITLTFVLALTAAARQESMPKRIALLVGIDRYAQSAIPTPELRGAKNDVARVRELLAKRFEFDVEVLLDEQATHRAIVESFHEHLIARAGPDTEVVFWFSGHGSRVPDASGVPGAEPDGKDSTLVAFDSRGVAPDGSFDVCDDELRSLLDALCARTSRVLVVTDSCHSGSADRGAAEQRVRFLPQGSRAFDAARVKAFWPADVALTEDVATTRPPASYAHIAACSPRQPAREIGIEDASGALREYGALTWYLAHALERAQPGTSIAAVADDAAARVALKVSGQVVWTAGACERVLFGAGFAAPTPGFRASAVSADEIAVEAGALDFLRRQSELELRGVLDGKLVGRATVTELKTTTCRARWLDGPHPDAPVMRAVEVSRPDGMTSLRVRYASDPRIAALVADIACIERVNAGADYTLDLDAVSNALRFATSEGIVIWREPTDAAKKSFETAVKQMVERTEKLELCASPGTLPLGLTFVEPDADDLREHADGAPLASAFLHDDGGLARAIGDTARPRERLGCIRIKNCSDRRVYVVLRSIAEGCGVGVIWGDEQGEGELAPGASKDVCFYTTIPADWPLARPMRDRYVAVATPDPPTSGARASRGAMQTSGVRGEWGVAAIDLFVELPARVGVTERDK